MGPLIGQTNRLVVVLFCLGDFFCFFATNRFCLSMPPTDFVREYFEAYFNHLLSKVKLFSSPVMNPNFQNLPDQKVAEISKV